MIGWYRRLLVKRKWLTFLLMGVFFFLFGVSSLNLFYLFQANIKLFIDHGVMVIGDGALLQLLELIFYALLSMVFYLMFKSCEYVLVHWITKPDDSAH